MAASRNQQPSYNFLTGGADDSHSSHAPAAMQQSRLPGPSTTSRRSSLALPRPSAIPSGVKPTYENEALRAQLNTLTYELSTLRQSHAVETETLGASVRDAERRGETEYRRAVEAERKLEAALKRLDDGLREAREEKTRAENAMREAERRGRAAKEEAGALREEVEDVKGMLAEGEREIGRLRGEMDGLREKVGREKAEVGRERDGAVEQLGVVQKRLVEREAKVGELESEVLKLKAQTGDKDTLDVIKRELAGQVGHIRQLEKVNTDQLGELKRLRRERRAVEVVEEEKRTLETRLGVMDQIKDELAEAHLQKSILEDERRAWTSYLEAQERDGNGYGIKSPEELARAFVRERVEKISLVEQMGRLQPEVAVKEQQITALEADVTRLTNEVKTARSSTTNGNAGCDSAESKSKARLERQRNLAVKEVEYLRAQLRSLEDETTEFDPAKADVKAATRTAELESLVDEYKAELASLHEQLNAAAPPAATAAAPVSLKRPLADDTDDSASSAQLSSLRRKLRTAQTELSTAQNTNTTLSTDLAALTSQLNALRASTRTRVLELKSNPTAQHAATKLSTLQTLQAENAALLAQLRTPTSISTDPSSSTSNTTSATSVPLASYTALEQRLHASQLELAQRDKKALRLKQIWAAKAGEFTQAVSSVLGWDVTFLPQGKLKLSSVYYRASTRGGRGSKVGGAQEEEEEEEEEEENFILFDGEKGTMKISGGERSRFARELRGMLEFWVDGRGEVPLFLAAASLEFWERASTAAAAAAGAGGGDGAE